MGSKSKCTSVWPAKPVGWGLSYNGYSHTGKKRRALKAHSYFSTQIEIGHCWTTPHPNHDTISAIFMYYVDSNSQPSYSVPRIFKLDGSIHVYDMKVNMLLFLFKSQFLWFWSNYDFLKLPNNIYNGQENHPKARNNNPFKFRSASATHIGWQVKIDTVVTLVLCFWGAGC